MHEFGIATDVARIAREGAERAGRIVSLRLRVEPWVEYLVERASERFASSRAPMSLR